LKILSALAGCALATAALAAPDELTLGKEQGYPLCTRSDDPACLVALWSRMDEVAPARKIRKAETPRPLRRAAQEPDLGLDYWLERNRNTGLLVMKDGEILAERYQYQRTSEHRLASASMAKTVVSMLVGIALSESRIESIDDRADKYVQGLKGHPYGETPLRHLLTMSSGVRFVEMYDGKDDASTLANLSARQKSEGGVATVLPFMRRNGPPGEKFSYASAETQVLGLVLREATGRPLADYLTEKIWQPMGAEADASWLIDNSGQEAAFCCLNAVLRDFARLGLLLAHDGNWRGRQLIPAAWVIEATTVPANQPYLRPGAVTDTLGYGYQTWIGPLHTVDDDRRLFLLWGVRGQRIYVDPRSRLVMVHTAVHAESVDTAALQEADALWSAVVNQLGR
jgi:CubicO group peptidase (beta-lactamase class C family)